MLRSALAGLPQEFGVVGALSTLATAFPRRSLEGGTMVVMVGSSGVGIDLRGWLIGFPGAFVRTTSASDERGRGSRADNATAGTHGSSSRGAKPWVISG